MSDYQKRFSWAKMRVGIVVTTALFVLLFTVLFAGNVERLFSPRATIFAVFNDVKGLRPGAPVWFAGVQIGSVRTIRLAAGEKITVSLTIDRDALSYLKKDSRIDILTLGLLGDKYIEVGVGSKEAEALRSGDTITGTSRPEIGEELSRLVDIVESHERGGLHLSRLLHRLGDVLRSDWVDHAVQGNDHHPVPRSGSCAPESFGVSVSA